MATTHPTRIGQLEDNYRAALHASNRAWRLFQDTCNGHGPLNAEQRQLLAWADEARAQLSHAAAALNAARTP